MYCVNDCVSTTTVHQGLISTPSVPQLSTRGSYPLPQYHNCPPEAALHSLSTTTVHQGPLSTPSVPQLSTRGCYPLPQYHDCPPGAALHSLSSTTVHQGPLCTPSVSRLSTRGRSALPQYHDCPPGAALHSLSSTTVHQAVDISTCLAAHTRLRVLALHTASATAVVCVTGDSGPTNQTQCTAPYAL